MNDKTTAELKAELRAEREYLASGLPAFRARSSRERIREMETELEARGDAGRPHAEAVHRQQRPGRHPPPLPLDPLVRRG